MTDFINIENREEFNEFLADLKKAKFVAADTETNGLRYYRGDYLISMSVYFPEFDRAYNLAFRHGEGEVQIEYNDKTEGKTFNEMTWAHKAKKQLFLRRWWSEFKATKDAEYFGNLPVEWLDEIKPLWGAKGVRYIFHNAPFDLHMLHQEGFPTPDLTEDTMLALHLLHEDWGGINLKAPFKEQGVWIIGDDGVPKKKTQRGNRKLKWQAMFWGFPNAHLGEKELVDAKTRLEREIVSYIYHPDRILDDTLTGYINEETGKRKQSLLLAAYFKDWEKADEKHRYTQMDKIRKRLIVDEKSNMWMLPSHEVATYAMLDTVLTWKLREKVLTQLEDWHNVERYYNICDIQLKVAWEMEKNGLLVDVKEARRQIKLYAPRIKELEAIFNDMAETLNEVHPEVPSPMNPASNDDIPVFMRYAVQYQWDLDEVLPDWINGEARATIDNRTHTVLEGQLQYTNKEALRDFENHPATRLLLEYRRLKKTIGTYLRKWVAVRDADGYIHPNMKVDGTVAGRFSSSGDMGNAQNIPERNGYTIKQAFIAPTEHILFAIDYGQLEARLAAWIAEILLPAQGAYKLAVPQMVNLFNEGADMHSYVRDIINVRDVMFGTMTTAEIIVAVGIDPATMTEEEQEEYVAKKLCRQIAKTANFSLLYSGTYRVLMKLLHIAKEPAMVIEKQWRDLFPAFALAQQHYEELAETWRPSPSGHTNGMYVTQPITGRHRKLHKYSTWQKYFDKNYGVEKVFNPRNMNARKTWNNVVQGLGGWMSVDSALRFAQDNGWGGIALQAQIHDALDGRVHLSDLHSVATLMEYMVDYETNPVLTVDLEAGYNWQPRSKENLAGMWEVANIREWIKTGGQYGYAIKRDGKSSYTSEHMDAPHLVTV